MHAKTRSRRSAERMPNVENPGPALLQRLLKHAKSDLAARREEAEADRERQLVTLLAADRLAARPALILLEIDSPRELQAIDIGHAFQHKVGDEIIGFQAVRAEALVPWAIDQIESMQPRRIDPVRPESRGLRLTLRSAGESHGSTGLRLWIDNPRLHAALTRSTCMVRTGASAPWVVVRVAPAGCVDAERMLPAPRLGSPARSLLTAWFLAPWAFLFIDIDGIPASADSSDGFEICFLGDDAALEDTPGSGAIRLNCVVAANLQKTSAHLNVEATTEWTLIPMAPEKALVAVTRVSWFDRVETWHECRPWLGTRHPAFGAAAPLKQYVLRERRDDDGRPSVLLGLVEPAGTLHDEGLTHLNVEVQIADRRLPRLTPGGEWRGDRGLRGRLVEGPSPFVYPAPLERGELHTEIAVGRLLSGGGSSDRTDRLRELLERCAARGDAAPKADALAQIASIKRFTVTPDPLGRLPGSLLLSLEIDSLAWPAGMLPIFKTALDRYLRLSAPVQAQTRLVVHTPEGDLS